MGGLAYAFFLVSCVYFQRQSARNGSGLKIAPDRRVEKTIAFLQVCSHVIMRY